MFKRISIYGLGLLGGSLCLKLRTISPGTRIIAYGRNYARMKPALAKEKVDEIGIIDESSPEGADLIVVSVPVLASVPIINKILADPRLSPQTLVIDVGSVKGRIVQEAVRTPGAAQFVGCHPMAGSEKSGYEYGSESLYDNSTVIITPHPGNKREDVGIISNFWKQIGARTVEVNPGFHDEILAKTSHLPHMAACVLVDMVRRLSETMTASMSIDFFIGNGFRDVTRIAAGSVDMWMEIAEMNRDMLCAVFDKLADSMSDLKHMISSLPDDKEQLREYLRMIGDYRRKL